MGLQQSASDPYGMGLMGGSADGDYSNPFVIEKALPPFLYPILSRFWS